MAARPNFLQLATALGEAGGLVDTPAGWRGYAAYLAYVNLSRGWALGTADFKASMIHDHALVAEARAWEGRGAEEIRELRWGVELERCLQTLRKTEAAAQGERKSAPWKAAVALRLKEATQASNRWLGERLHMGRPEAVSVYVGRLRRSGAGKNPDYAQLVTNV